MFVMIKVQMTQESMCSNSSLYPLFSVGCVKARYSLLSHFWSNVSRFFCPHLVRLFSLSSNASLPLSYHAIGYLADLLRFLCDYMVQPKSLRMTELTVDPPYLLFLCLSFIQAWQQNYNQVMYRYFATTNKKNPYVLSHQFWFKLMQIETPIVI